MNNFTLKKYPLNIQSNNNNNNNNSGKLIVRDGDILKDCMKI